MGDTFSTRIKSQESSNTSVYKNEGHKKGLEIPVNQAEGGDREKYLKAIRLSEGTRNTCPPE